MDIQEENIEYEVDNERAKLLFSNDEGDIHDNRVDTLKFSKRRLYLDFEK